MKLTQKILLLAANVNKLYTLNTHKIIKIFKNSTTITQEKKIAKVTFYLLPVVTILSKNTTYICSLIKKK